MTEIMLTPFGWVIAFGLFGLLLAVGGWIGERWEAHRDRQLRSAARRHPSTGGRR